MKFFKFGPPPTFQLALPREKIQLGELLGVGFNKPFWKQFQVEGDNSALLSTSDLVIATYLHVSFRWWDMELENEVIRLSKVDVFVCSLKSKSILVTWNPPKKKAEKDNTQLLSNKSKESRCDLKRSAWSRLWCDRRCLLGVRCWVSNTRRNKFSALSSSKRSSTHCCAEWLNTDTWASTFNEIEPTEVRFLRRTSWKILVSSKLDHLLCLVIYKERLSKRVIVCLE